MSRSVVHAVPVESYINLLLPGMALYLRKKVLGGAFSLLSLTTNIEVKPLLIQMSRKGVTLLSNPEDCSLQSLRLVELSKESL